MYCAKCGGLVEHTAVYCPYCGHIFSAAELRRQNRLPNWMLVLAGLAAITSVVFAWLSYSKGPAPSATIAESYTSAPRYEPPVVVPTIVPSRPSPSPTSTPLPPTPKPTSTPTPLPPPPAPMPEPEQAFSKIMRGTINNRYPIEMALRRRGDTLSGTYFYLKQGISISLEGTIDEGRNVTLNGYDRDGAWIDIFQGRFVSDSELVGTWSKPNGERSAPFRVREIN